MVLFEQGLTVDKIVKRGESEIEPRACKPKHGQEDDVGVDTLDYLEKWPQVNDGQVDKCNQPDSQQHWIIQMRFVDF